MGSKSAHGCQTNFPLTQIRLIYRETASSADIPTRKKAACWLQPFEKAGPRKACGSVIPSHKPRIVQAVREGVEDALNQRDQVKQSDSAQAGQQHPVLCPWMKSRFHSMPPSGRQMVRQGFLCQPLFRKPGIELHCSQNLSIVALTFMIHNYKCFESVCAD